MEQILKTKTDVSYKNIRLSFQQYSKNTFFLIKIKNFNVN
jgi:hypothetical protein